MISEKITVANSSNEELKIELFNSMVKANYIAEINSVTTEKIEYSVSRGRNKTKVIISRSRHTGHQVNLMVAHRQQISAAAYNTYQSRRNRGGNLGRTSYFKYYIMFIVGLYIFNFVRSQFTGNESIFQSNFFLYLFLSLLVLVLSYYFYFKPQLKISNLKSKEIFDREIFDFVKASLISYTESRPSVIKKCWNCFEEINVNEIFCPVCGKQIK